MEIEIKNSNFFKDLNVLIKEMTIICGENNTGKSYIAHKLYELLLSYEGYIIRDIEEKEFQDLINNKGICIYLNKYLYEIKENIYNYSTKTTEVLHNSQRKESFNLNENFNFQYIENTSFQKVLDFENKKCITLSKAKGTFRIYINLLFIEKSSWFEYYVREVIRDCLRETLFKYILPSPFLINTSRFNNKSNLLKLSFSSFIKELNYVIYNNKLNFIKEKYPYIIKDFNKIIKGSFLFNEKTEELSFTSNTSNEKLNIINTSTTLCSLINLFLYLNYFAKPGDILIIDKPELGLSPNNQTKIARLLSSLINIGINVFITTHSDYVIKEMNTLISLDYNNMELKDIAKRYGYYEREFLPYEKVQVYISSNKDLIPASITKEGGIEIKTFDECITRMNDIQNEIYSAY